MTAKEFVDNKLNEILGIEWNCLDSLTPYDVATIAKEFALHHVTAALNAASEKAVVDYNSYYYEGEDKSYNVDESSILNAYPLTNIL